MAKKIYEEITTKQTMNRVKEARMPFEWSINPYRGCTHGCGFCYARSTHSFLGMSVDDSFQNHILLKTNAAEALEMQLAKLASKHKGKLREVARHVGLVAIGTATDPYQPIEAKAEITRECLKVLAKYRIPTAITTRSPLILRDIDILSEMNVTSLNISVNTLNTDVYRRVEPATPFPLKRLETVQKLVEAGLPAGVFIAPILPYITDSDAELEELVSAAKSHQAQYAVPSVLRLAPEVKEWYYQVLQQTSPHLLPAYRKLYPKGYPTSGYLESLRQKVHTLLTKYQLSTETPHPRIDDTDLPPLQPELAEEQLSFSF